MVDTNCPINNHPESDGICKKEKCELWTVAGNYVGCAYMVGALMLSDIRNAIEEIKLRVG